MSAERNDGRHADGAAAADYRLALRDYFAAHAMREFMRDRNEHNRLRFTFQSSDPGWAEWMEIEWTYADIAQYSYEMADAMLQARNV